VVFGFLGTRKIARSVPAAVLSIDTYLGSPVRLDILSECRERVRRRVEQIVEGTVKLPQIEDQPPVEFSAPREHPSFDELVEQGRADPDVRRSVGT
jgi:hypothetical protein